MTIHRLDHRCWVIDDPADDHQPHHDDEAAAASALAILKEDTPGTAAKIRELSAPCWLVRCDGECEVTLDTEGEGYIVHCESRQEAEELMADCEWRYVGDLVFCEEDAPDGGEVPPPSPAQQEAAGQLVIPGVLP